MYLQFIPSLDCLNNFVKDNAHCKEKWIFLKESIKNMPAQHASMCGTVFDVIKLLFLSRWHPYLPSLLEGNQPEAVFLVMCDPSMNEL